MNAYGSFDVCGFYCVCLLIVLSLQTLRLCVLICFWLFILFALGLFCFGFGLFCAFCYFGCLLMWWFGLVIACDCWILRFVCVSFWFLMFVDLHCLIAGFAASAVVVY